MDQSDWLGSDVGKTQRRAGLLPGLVEKLAASLSGKFNLTVTSVDKSTIALLRQSLNIHVSLNQSTLN
jgi:hypothetical protein